MGSKRGPMFLIHNCQRTGNAEPDRTSLPRQASTHHVRGHIELTHRFRYFEWAEDIGTNGFKWEVVLNGSTVDHALSRAWTQSDPCNGSFPASDDDREVSRCLLPFANGFYQVDLLDDDSLNL